MEKDIYTKLKITGITAELFKKFARKLGQSQNDTLLLMLEFFNTNALSPKENIGPRMTTLEKNLNKRIDQIVAIIRNIESTQTKPTKAMVQQLSQSSSSRKTAILLEKKIVQQKSEYSTAESSISSSELRLQRRQKETQKSLQTVMERVELVYPRFGKKYLKLNMSLAEFNALKHTLKINQ